MISVYMNWRQYLLPNSSCENFMMHQHHFNTLYTLSVPQPKLLPCKVVVKSYDVTIQMKAAEQYFLLVLFIVLFSLAQPLK